MMRALPVIIIVIVVSLSIGLGQVFNLISADQSEPAGDSAVDGYETMLRHLADTLSRSATPEAFITNWQDSDVTLTLSDLRSVALPKSLTQQLDEGSVLTLQEPEHVVMYAKVGEQPAILALSIPFEEPEPDLQSYWLSSLFYGTLIGLLMLCMLPLATRLLALRRATHAFGQGDLSQRVNIGRVSYVRDLEHDFNTMAARIESLVEDIRLLSSALSHDLRTPLARLRLGLDTLMEEQDPDKRAEYEARLNQQLDDMVDMLAATLTYARLEHTLHTTPTQQLDVVKLVTLTADQYTRTDSLSVKVSHSTGDTTQIVNADRHHLKRVFDNLLSNACRYAAAQVLVTITTEHNSAVIAIEDDGPGVSSDMQEQIFKPFVRSAMPSDRTNSKKNKEGYGIGLAFAHRVVQWHGGTIELRRSEKAGGACFTIKLPLARL